ncbi:hypothetical protein Pcinc_004150 [Petrolisthes cinctipes]|uniref:diphosphoinositol-polyphosphate diphosphatase n=1 Tax=Petrolisthes cinctipes TaxID=88211 RepID=A0AAE1L1D3_PETCI|nr:hypothetical protein Pcinc_004150 [Petrolisthes cinctipes]
MTAVACEGVYWWRSNNSPHEPPAAPQHQLRNRHLVYTPIPTRVNKTSSESTCYYANTLLGDTVPFPSNYYQPYLSLASVSPKYPITQQLYNKRVVKLLTGKEEEEVEGVVSARSRMHAQATSGSLNVNTVDEISLPRKLSSATQPQPPLVDVSKTLDNPLNNTLHQQELCNRAPCSYSASPSSSSSCPHTSTNLTYQDNYYYTQVVVPVSSTNANTTVATTLRTLSTSTNAIADSANQNTCSGWVFKNFTKLSSSSNSSSRGSVSAKNKSGCIRRRLTDEEGYIRRAACICVNKEETKVMLVSSKKDPCVWLVPGGGLEMGEDAVTAAKREAWEEAGILGHVARYLGMFESCHHSGVKKHRTAVYIFVVTEEHSDFPEATLGRRRQWFSLEEALLHLARNRPLQSAYLQLLMMSKLKVAAAS